MKRLLLFAAGGAVGYVLGAKAGRERYDQIVALVGQTPSHLPRSLSDLTGTAAGHADSFTESARDKAHATLDVVGEKVDAVAEKVEVVDAKVDDVADTARSATRKATGEATRRASGEV